ncbi:MULTISPECIES: hypothetical protein [Thiomicrorhabdus]|uniref:DUF3718 domain-containing protein n=1 Tax=Thiomicrorhabdus heinhorstiae TaxID=2748010 RepID=A0ABS0BWU1_9GAMM|nr:MULTISPECIES: hypothetical protein [Thiomicrorhabdus]MBF6058249.1 hypothetical protein [Thiomicrorhabdus heinhorstiae]
MKATTKTTKYTLGLIVGALLSAQTFTAAAQDRNPEMAQKRTLDLCVEYYGLDNDADRGKYLKELNLRAQLSEKDHKLVPKHQVEPSMTMCGMYMSRGKPLAEQGRQLRPMVFKVVHVYPDMYYVTQSGMVVAAYERTEGSMPPKLYEEVPEVAPPPMMKHSAPMPQ